VPEPPREAAQGAPAAGPDADMTEPARYGAVGSDAGMTEPARYGALRPEEQPAGAGAGASWDDAQQGAIRSEEEEVVM